MNNQKIVVQQKQAVAPISKTEKTLEKRPVKQKIAAALDQMRDVIRFPLDTSPDRDEKIKSVWRSGS